jgi:hypothetical protein
MSNDDGNIIVIIIIIISGNCSEARKQNAYIYKDTIYITKRKVKLLTILVIRIIY